MIEKDSNGLLQESSSRTRKHKEIGTMLKKFESQSGANWYLNRPYIHHQLNIQSMERENKITIDSIQMRK